MIGKVFLVICAFPFVLIVRLLRSFVVIRFGLLPSDRIGHFAGNVELYVCQRDIDVHRRKTVDFFYHNSFVANYQLKKMWAMVIRIYPFVKWLAIANKLLAGAEYHIVPMTASRDVDGLLSRVPKHLSFTASEEKIGRDLLINIGIPSESQFVCFNARDSAYLEFYKPNHSYKYHDYRDSTIHNYLLAAEEMTRRGYWAIRMGAVVKEKLNTNNARIIDYAVNHRSDFMDIYLCSRCKFFICDTAGIYAIASIFRRPIAWVNYIPLEYVPGWERKHIFIPKKLWLRKEKRFLTFREIIGSGIGRFLVNDEYDRLGIEVIENTADEIMNLAVEMDQRLNGAWHVTDEDEMLQQRFLALFKPSGLNKNFFCRIGADFLRNNKELLQ